MTYCPKCQMEFEPKEDGIGVIDYGSNGAETLWWTADLWECPGCGMEIAIHYSRGE